MPNIHGDSNNTLPEMGAAMGRKMVADYRSQRRDRAGAGGATGCGRLEPGADRPAHGPASADGRRFIGEKWRQSGGIRRRPRPAGGARADFRRSRRAKNIEIELLINNAGFGAFGNNHEVAPARLTEMVQVNCSAVVHLTRLFVPPMVERKHGDVMIVASTAAFQPVPFIAAYAATKAFDLIFAEGIAEELRPFGVHVCALCPGSTNTEFQQVAGQPDRMFRVAETAEKVARVGLEGLARRARQW